MPELEIGKKIEQHFFVLRYRLFAFSLLLVSALLPRLSHDWFGLPSQLIAMPIILVFLFVAGRFLVRLNFGVASYLMILFVAWYFYVFLNWGGLSAAGLNRLLIIVLYGLIFWVGRGLVQSLDDWFDFLSRVFWLGTLYLFIVNALVQPSFANILDPQFVRYDGVSGPNFHGITASLSLMAGVSVWLRYRKSLYLFSLFPAAINLWMTGSRAAMLTFLLFIFVALVFRARIWAFIFLALSVIFVMVAISNPDILMGFRFDEVSINGRVHGIDWAQSKIIQSGGVPFGLGVMAQQAELNRLDNSFLMVALESGVVGLLLLIFISGMAIFKLIASEVGGKKVKVKAGYVPGAFVIVLLFHGLFETYIWSGLELGMVIMLVAMAYLSRIDTHFMKSWHQRIKEGRA
jgi:hypothetical protein